MKYKIIPIKTFEAETEANSPEEAIASFATVMDSDMHLYFKAVTEEEYKAIKEEESDSAAHARFVTAFMKNTILSDFEITDEEKAQTLAEEAYELYCLGNGFTEYECIEFAVKTATAHA